jgi:peptidyl-prolyl cis-trans isomerase C
MVAPFSDAVAALDDGEYTSTPVQTEFGWHVILREESRETEAPTFDSVRDNIEQVIQQNKFQAYLEQLRAAEKE